MENFTLTNNTLKKELRSATEKLYLVIEYDSINRYIYNNWIGYVSVQNLMIGADACLDMLKGTKCNKLLNDNRDLVGPWIEANDWIENNWTPRAIAAGFRYFAHIVSPGVFAALSAEDMQKRVSGKFEMQMFDDIENARAWLKSKN